MCKSRDHVAPSSNYISPSLAVSRSAVRTNRIFFVRYTAGNDHLLTDMQGTCTRLISKTKNGRRTMFPTFRSHQLKGQKWGWKFIPAALKVVSIFSHSPRCDSSTVASSALKNWREWWKCPLRLINLASSTGSSHDTKYDNGQHCSWRGRATAAVAWFNIYLQNTKLYWYHFLQIVGNIS